MRNGANLAGKSELAYAEKLVRKGNITPGGDQRERNADVGRGLLNSYAADNDQVNVNRGKTQAEPLFKHGKDERRAIVINTV